MILYAYLRVGPHGRIYIPAEFNKHIGLPDGPAFIEAKLCIDGYIELGPVIPGSTPPRAVSEILPSLVVPETFDEPLPPDELDAWESDGDLWDDRAAGSAQRSAESETLMPDGWTVLVEDGRVRVGSPGGRSEFCFNPSEARALGLALRVASSDAGSRESGGSKGTGTERSVDE